MPAATVTTAMEMAVVFMPTENAMVPVTTITIIEKNVRIKKWPVWSVVKTVSVIIINVWVIIVTIRIILMRVWISVVVGHATAAGQN
jgi:hypothetical protein